MRELSREQRHWEQQSAQQPIGAEVLRLERAQARQAGIIGVLVTRGHPSIIYPEQILTFRLEAPLNISTERSQQAFRYVEPGEYDRPAYNGPQTGANYGYGSGPYAAATPYPAPYYGYPYPYYGYGYGYPYWGPSFSLFFGPGYSGRSAVAVATFGARPVLTMAPELCALQAARCVAALPHAAVAVVAATDKFHLLGTLGRTDLVGWYALFFWSEDWRR